MAASRIPKVPPRFASYILWRVVPPTLVIMLLAGLAGLWVAHSMILSSVHARLQAAADTQQGQIADRMDTLIKQIQHLARNDLIINGLIHALDRDFYLPLFFQSLSITGMPSERIALVDFMGREIVATGPQTRPDLPETLLHELKIKKKTVHMTSHGIEVMIPILVNGFPEGGLVFSLPAETIPRLKNMDRTDLDIAFIDANQNIIMANTSYRQRFGLHVPENTSDWIFMSRSIDTLSGVRLLLGQDRHAALEPVRKLAFYMFLITSCGIAALISSVIAGTRLAVGSVNKLSQAIGSVVNHRDLNRRIKLDGPFELQELARAFNRTLETLQQTTTSTEILEQSREQFALAAKGSNDGIWDWDLRKNTLYLSPKWKEQLGYKDGELSNDFSTFTSRIHPDDRQMVLEKVNLYISCKIHQYENEFRMLHKDGSFRWILARGAAMRDQSGTPYRLAGSHTDITQRKKTELALTETNISLGEALAVAEEMAVKARRANIAKSRFLANMSHEIRTPMNAILGFAHVLARDTLLSPQQKDHITIILRSGHHLLQLINDILDMSRIEAGETHLVSQDFSLSDLIRDVEMIFRTRATEKGLQFLVEKSDSLPLYLHADETKLRQILINLLGNAIKFTEEGGVTLRIRSDHHFSEKEPNTAHMIFEVADSGPGLDENESSLLFEAFHQTLEGFKAGGTGLGLTISRNFAEMMNGSLTCSSQRGHGATFRLEIPLRVVDRLSSIELSPLPQAVIPDPGRDPIRILVADDVKENRSLLHALLKPLGFQIRDAENGAEATRITDSWHPHAILMDIRMPVMDGYEATRRIKSDITQKSPVIIALTATVFEDERGAVMAAGVDAFLRKPFQPRELFDILASSLQLQYIFTPTTLQAAESPQSALASLPSSPSLLSCEERRDFGQAVREGDTVRLYEMIRQTASRNSPAALALESLAKDYEYEKLLAWLAPTDRKGKEAP
ncbi:ATP-binding protein [Desulfobotulus sp. H1]|uniref:histidine kinase n=1 Tax=Desulfobotulus pelophilus TaxID=2823377 RepID=A0ABT3N621_9BACT|nr:ATP-binding protein [Desulfobotulus pelophilus]MCW7752899.1 ATP-binding protein [Desulfobotulus pelophilus]